MAKKLLKGLANWLVILGAIVWGLVGAFGFNLVESLVGSFSKWVYIAVGLSGLFVGWQRLKK